ncbi:MAG: NrfD/PsrC family molybdoenzyme membrane anchor subunit [Terriglobales bacterium]
MSTVPEIPERLPDEQSESRLAEIRREAKTRGQVRGLGIRPPGAPFPQASPESGYYGIPMLKQPQWTWQIPLYFFVGGAAGSAGVIGSIADLIGGDYELARKARWLALGGAAASGALLVWDLGRPSRFLNMLRVFKPQSPMSMGAWILAAFSNFAAAASFGDLMQARFGRSLPVSLIRGAGRIGSAMFGLPFHNYTGVLIGATAVPVWNHKIKELPRHFGMSGLQSAVSILELLGHQDSRALNILGLLSSGFETYEGFKIETEQAPELDPLKHGASGWVTRAGGVLSGPVPLTLRMLGWRSPTLRRWAAISGIAGSVLTRYAWMLAGKTSAKNWRLPLEIPEAAAEPKAIPEEISDRLRRTA